MSASRRHQFQAIGSSDPAQCSAPSPWPGGASTLSTARPPPGLATNQMPLVIWLWTLWASSTSRTPSAADGPSTCGASVARATAARSSTGALLAVADHGRGVAEELLHVLLVGVAGLLADGGAEPDRFDERLDRAGGRVVVGEALLLERPVVD